MNKGTNNSGGSGSGTQPCVLNHPETEKVFTDFRKDCLDTLLPIAKSDAAVAKTNFDSAFEAVCDDRKTLGKAEDTRSIYLSIYYEVAISLHKDIVEAHKRVEEQSGATADLGKSFSTAVGKFKEACSKVMDVQSKAQALADTATKTCNAETVNKVETKLKSKSNDAAYPFKNSDGTPITDLKSTDKAKPTVLGMLKGESEAAFKQANEATERAVKVAGIYTFLNVQRLKEYTEKLQGQSGAFKTDAEGNLKNADEKIKAAQKSLGDDLVKLGELEAGWMKAQSRADAIFDAGEAVTKITPDGKNVETVNLVGPCAVTGDAEFKIVCDRIEALTK